MSTLLLVNAKGIFEVTRVIRGAGLPISTAQRSYLRPVFRPPVKESFAPFRVGWFDRDTSYQSETTSRTCFQICAVRSIGVTPDSKGTSSEHKIEARRSTPARRPHGAQILISRRKVTSLHQNPLELVRSFARGLQRLLRSAMPSLDTMMSDAPRRQLESSQHSGCIRAGPAELRRHELSTFQPSEARENDQTPPLLIEPLRCLGSVFDVLAPRPPKRLASQLVRICPGEKMRDLLTAAANYVLPLILAHRLILSD